MAEKTGASEMLTSGIAGVLACVAHYASFGSSPRSFSIIDASFVMARPIDHNTFIMSATPPMSHATPRHGDRDETPDVTS